MWIFKSLPCREDLHHPQWYAIWSFFPSFGRSFFRLYAKCSSLHSWMDPLAQTNPQFLPKLITLAHGDYSYYFLYILLFRDFTSKKQLYSFWICKSHASFNYILYFLFNQSIIVFFYYSIPQALLFNTSNYEYDNHFIAPNKVHRKKSENKANGKSHCIFYYGSECEWAKKKVENLALTECIYSWWWWWYWCVRCGIV